MLPQIGLPVESSAKRPKHALQHRLCYFAEAAEAA